MRQPQVITLRKGLVLPISGAPRQVIEPGAMCRQVALMVTDYLGLKPTMLVKEGEVVKLGQPLLEDKKTPGVVYTSPGAGKVVAINRGDRRRLLSVVIELSDVETQDSTQVFEHYTRQPIAELTAQSVRELLIESGVWTAFRTRPFSKVPLPESKPHSIFVTAIDTDPLAPQPEVVLSQQLDMFEQGLAVVSKLTEGKTFLCHGAEFPTLANYPAQVEPVAFVGPHPAGTPGVHIHHLDPVHRGKTVWHIGYQDVLAIGHLFETGRISVERVVALAGPSVKNPRLVRTRCGAALEPLLANDLHPGDHRVVSGSVFTGRTAQGEIMGYLGNHHRQVVVLPEDRTRHLLGWLGPGLRTYSVLNLFLSRFLPPKNYDCSTSTHGSRRAMVPLGVFEELVPMDIMPTHLLRALAAKDLDQAEQLGCLELDEEDLALCSFADFCKNEYGSILRENLDILEKEG